MRVLLPVFEGKNDICDVCASPSTDISVIMIVEKILILKMSKKAAYIMAATSF